MKEQRSPVNLRPDFSSGRRFSRLLQGTYDYGGANSRGLADSNPLLSPNAFIISFSATRAHTPLLNGFEDAGLEVRDVAIWVHNPTRSRGTAFSDGTVSTLSSRLDPVIVAGVAF